MSNKFSPGDKVNVAELAKDTGVTASGIAVSSLAQPGIVVEYRDHPPHVTGDPGEAAPSPHCLVAMKAPDGSDAEAWFIAARLTAA